MLIENAAREVPREEKLFAAALVVWILLASYVMLLNPVVQNNDVFGFIRRADDLKIGVDSGWLNGLYPFGYPLLLKAVATLLRDYEIAGRLISFASAIGCILMIRRAGELLFSRRIGLSASIICCFNPVFFRYARASGIDMPSAFFCFLSLLLIIEMSMRIRYHNLSPLIPGVILGLGYLIRYTGLILLPVYILWIIIAGRQTFDSKTMLARLHLVGVLILGFLIGAFPQLVLAIAQKGSPFWNTQGYNVYFGMFGEQNWGQNWNEALNHPSIAKIIQEYPIQFIKNLLKNAANSIKFGFFFPYPFLLLGWPSLLLSLWHADEEDRKDSSGVYSCRMLLALTLIGYTFAICIAFLNSRLLLFPAILFSIYVAIGLTQIPPPLIWLGSRKLAFRSLFYCASISLLLAMCVKGYIARPVSAYDLSRIEVSQRIYKLLPNDESRAQKVLSLSFDFYDLQSRLKTPYSMDWYKEGNDLSYSSFANIHSAMRKRGQQYLVFNGRAPNNVPGLSSSWPPNDFGFSDYFEEIYRSENAVIAKPRGKSSI